MVQCPRYFTPGTLALRREAIALSVFQDSTISVGNNVYRETTIETGTAEKTTRSMIGVKEDIENAPRLGALWRRHEAQDIHPSIHR